MSWNNWGLFRYIRQQTGEVLRGGLPVLLRKGRILLKIVCSLHILLLLAPVAVLLIRALRPLILIRVGPLESRRIGHFAANTEVYLCERDAGIGDKCAIDIFYHPPPVCNQQLKKMWNRTLRIYRIAWPVDVVNRLLPGFKRHLVPMPSDRDIHRLLANSKPHLSFTRKEEKQGLAKLREMGIPDGTDFICFANRDRAYLDGVPLGRNFQAQNYRDSNIRNYIPAVEAMTRRGYFILRMGAIVEEALTTTNPLIIDYANKYRSDFLDIFLGAKCRFFIVDTAGIHAIPKIFRRPIAYVNFIPLEYAPTWFPRDLFIPKKLRRQGAHRLMTFREILDSGIGRFVETEEYEKLRIETVENTPEEITALAVEMDERLKGTWQTTEEDEKLQHRFCSLFKQSELNSTFLSRIGTEFLRQNVKLLD